jgi:hypothetical protein
MIAALQRFFACWRAAAWRQDAEATARVFVGRAGAPRAVRALPWLVERVMTLSVPITAFIGDKDLLGPFH